MHFYQANVEDRKSLTNLLHDYFDEARQIKICTMHSNPTKCVTTERKALNITYFSSLSHDGAWFRT